MDDAFAATVHCVFLDTTKASDRVNYCKLFKLLTECNIPPFVIRVLLTMYTDQNVTKVMCNGYLSGCFGNSNYYYYYKRLI